jgi:hypothetical protein
MGGESQVALTRYRVTVEALEPLALPAYLGSTLRGAFGHAFRALCCPARAGESCPVPDACPYHETRWATWSRYSARQDRRMEWAGLVGTATYAGDLRPFWPYLVFGQWVHVGKGATFGLGAYRLEAGDGAHEATA